ncbi:hypothetical protein ACGRHY_30015 [Streptomyces sp. HK10]|uniref:hypothetical protein n=1 Tax=Streptomyces sp. HK10 TaxID=3373255 RepID=UPI003747AB52
MSIAGKKGARRTDAPPMTVTRVLYRHVTGLEYDGVPRTNATWTEPGDAVLHESGRARRWSYRPRLQRAAIRWAWTAGAAAEGAAAIVAPALAEGAAATAAGTAAVWSGYRTSEAVLGWSRRRRVVRPLAKALARPLENSPDNVLRGLVVPGRTDREDATVTVPVPDGWHGDRKAVESIVAARLGGDWDAEWRLREAPFTAVFTRAPSPPGMVKWAEVLPHIAQNAPGEIVVGLNSRGLPVRGDFVREEPMWGLSIGSGGGKSVFLWTVAAQLVAQGATLVGIDPKYVSLDPLVGVPGVEIHNDPRDVGAMWDAIRRFRETMEDRFAQWTQDRSLEFPRMVLMLEEGNMFSDLSKDYWREVKKKGDPAQPPVWGDIAAILRMGRQANANMIAVFQRMDDASTGGRGLRDSFGFRMLGRFTWQAWRMLIGTTPIPRSQKKRGRFIVVDGGAHTWVQAPYATPEEIRAYCLAAREAQGWEEPAPVSPQGRPDGVSVCDQGRDTAPTGTGTPVLTLVKGDGGAAEPPRPRLYTLAEAARENVVPLSYEALKKARQRTGFPAPADTGKRDRWTAEQLTEWHANRPGKKTAEGEEKEAAGE